jgi:hypothetical protein
MDEFSTFSIISLWVEKESENLMFWLAEAKGEEHEKRERKAKIYPASWASINQNSSVRKFILFNFDLWKAFGVNEREIDVNEACVVTCRRERRGEFFLSLNVFKYKWKAFHSSLTSSCVNFQPYSAIYRTSVSDSLQHLIPQILAWKTFFFIADEKQQKVWDSEKAN